MKARLQWLFFLMLAFLQPLLNIAVCPKLCHCQTYQSASSMNVVSCDGLGLTSFPINMDPNVTHLDLSSNDISEISVNHFRNLSSLRELILADNPIIKIPDGTFDHLSSLLTLYLSETLIETVPAFTVASSVVDLHLDNTNIKDLLPKSLRYYSNLEGLYLKRSKIKRLNSRVFRHARKLKYLLMEYSMLNSIEEDAFDGIQLHTLSLQGTHISSLPVSGLEKLVNLNLEDVHSLRQLHPSQLPNIRHLLLTHEFLCCSFVNKFSEDGGKAGRDAQECKHTNGVNTEYPTIYPHETNRSANGSSLSLPKKPYHNLPSMFSPSFVYNPRSTINFRETDNVNDPSSSLQEKAYSNLSLMSANANSLKNSEKISSLLSIFANQSTRLVRKRRISSNTSSSHSPSNHETTIQSDLPLRRPTKPRKSTKSNEKGATIFSTHSNQSSTNMSGKFPTRMRRQSTRMQFQNSLISLSFNGSLLVFSLDPCDPEPFPSGPIEETQRRKRLVVCRLKLDEFNPCEDLLGSLTLQVCTWLIAVCATAGNLITLIIILLNRRKITNHKLLMCTLAFSNLCMGVYLIILAAVDARTRGSYHKYAKQWQQGVGCKIAGFLSIFSTELSVFTLNIITLERYYTILFPLHQVKWMTVKQTSISLVLSFLTAFVLAVLPLTGISSYTKVAICLPFDVKSPTSKAYVTFLLASNGASFFAVFFAYTKMYFNIQHTARATFTELNIAKKMAVIVLTNFSCWAPIAVFSLFAIYGEPLIDVLMSKFLLVFVFPINALTNPFLYFLVTKRFQQDLQTVIDRCLSCVYCARARYSKRKRAESVRTSFTRTTNNSRSRSSSANTLISIFRRTPGRSSTDNQCSAPRLSISREAEDKRAPMLQRTLTFVLPTLKRKRRNDGADTMLHSNTLRRKSYQIAAKNNNILPEKRRTRLVSNYHESQQKKKKCETHINCESAC